MQSMAFFLWRCFHLLVDQIFRAVKLGHTEIVAAFSFFVKKIPTSLIIVVFLRCDITIELLLLDTIKMLNFSEIRNVLCPFFYFILLISSSLDELAKLK